MLAFSASAKQGHLISCCLQEAAVCYRYCSCRRYYPEPPRSSISSILIGLHHTATSRHTHTHSCTRADRNRCRHKCARKQRVCGCTPWHALRLNICSKKKMLICTWFPLSLTQITVDEHHKHFPCFSPMCIILPNASEIPSGWMCTYFEIIFISISFLIFHVLCALLQK